MSKMESTSKTKRIMNDKTTLDCNKFLNGESQVGSNNDQGIDLVCFLFPVYLMHETSLIVPQMFEATPIL